MCDIISFFSQEKRGSINQINIPTVTWISILLRTSTVGLATAIVISRRTIIHEQST
jgi:hypothetical protein